eukprot:TRINITY_DN149_c3_g1_i2.p1 TRINITY_DN149_c3_g1~~TRINITY_DN149_c3_g1_i2.p1  ORF type:complete len:272 (+),score=42.70 TRINITY_DN149_c3_g1_i2:66-881(+)
MSVDEINFVLATKDYYARLGVGRDASVEEVKRCYKRMAVKLHPDKNTLPRAEEAFKAIGQANAVLTDPQKRRIYDQVGEEGLTGEGGRRGGYTAQQPEDLFDLFDILRGFQPPPRRHQRHAPRPREPNGFIHFMNSLPILVLLLFYILSGMGLDTTDTVPYSLKEDYERGYTELRVTGDWAKVPYYVRPSFRRDYAGNRRAIKEIDDSVFKAYKGMLLKNCRKEKAHRDSLIQKAGLYSNADEMLEKNYELPSCKELSALSERHKNAKRSN